MGQRLLVILATGQARTVNDLLDELSLRWDIDTSATCVSESVRVLERRALVRVERTKGLPVRVSLARRPDAAQGTSGAAGVEPA